MSKINFGNPQADRVYIKMIVEAGRIGQQVNPGNFNEVANKNRDYFNSLFFELLAALSSGVLINPKADQKAGEDAKDLANLAKNYRSVRKGDAAISEAYSPLPQMGKMLLDSLISQSAFK